MAGKRKVQAAILRWKMLHKHIKSMKRRGEPNTFMKLQDEFFIHKNETYIFWNAREIKECQFQVMNKNFVK